MNTFKKTLTVVAIGAQLLSQTLPVCAQGVKNRPAVDRPDEAQIAIHSQTAYDLSKLNAKWTEYTSNAAFKALVDKAKSEGFERIVDNDKFAWGFEGTFKRGASPKMLSAEACAFDFIKKGPTSQMASMVFRNDGTEVYRALIIFPAGATSVQSAIAGAVEYYVDKSGTIQRAHSFKTCFNSCLLNSAAFCAVVLTPCAAAATLIGFTGAGMPFALGLLASCAGLACVFPMAVCAVRC